VPPIILPCSLALSEHLLSDRILCSPLPEQKRASILPICPRSSLAVPLCTSVSPLSVMALPGCAVVLPLTVVRVLHVDSSLLSLRALPLSSSPLFDPLHPGLDPLAPLPLRRFSSNILHRDRGYQRPPLWIWVAFP
jgi:hypothetical protein